MYISWEFACTSVQGLVIGTTEYWDSLVCHWLLAHICNVEHVKRGARIIFDACSMWLREIICLQYRSRALQLTLAWRVCSTLSLHAFDARVTGSYTQRIWNCVLYYTKSFNYKSLSTCTCSKDKTLTVQCIFVAKNCLLTPNLYPSAYPFKKYISAMFYDNFC